MAGAGGYSGKIRPAQGWLDNPLPIARLAAAQVVIKAQPKAELKKK
jgi:hypothetical protein